MKFADRVLQNWRIRKARPFIPNNARVLDIGCGDGALFKALDGQLLEGVGIDPELASGEQTARYQLIAGYFPQDLPSTAPFDSITMLAVLEHIPAKLQKQWASDCARCLKSGGHLIITVPSPQVDAILDILTRLKIIDGMSLEQHYGFEAKQTPNIFQPELKLIKAATFQLGLNNLFVFQKV
jgi:2-polyprenyl-3-methyl-5-hydroxy-6-metoxy-1,4-benzoquinol methylase